MDAHDGADIRTAAAAAVAAPSSSPAAVPLESETAVEPPLAAFDAPLLEVASDNAVPVHPRPQRLQTNSSGAAVAAAASGSAVPPTAAHPQPVASVAAVASAPFPSLPPLLTYDSMLGHVTRLYRGGHQMERMLRRRTQRQSQPPPGQASVAATAAADTRLCEVCFVDPFGTPMQIPVQPWQSVADTVQQLQPYIPQHLQGWCQIGTLRPPARGLLPSSTLTLAHIDLTDSADNSTVVTSATAVSASPDVQRQAARVQPLSLSTLHMTLAHAQLVPSSGVASSADSAPGRACGCSGSTSTAEVSAASTLLAYGNLTVLLRHAPPASAPSSSRAESTRGHTLSLQVFGLDLLSDVLARVTAHAAEHLSLRVRRADLYALRRSFTLPLHLLSAADCGGAGDAVRLNQQQSVFSAQLAGSGDAERILLVEVVEAERRAARGPSLRISVRLLSGQQLQMAALPGDTVAALKAAIAARDVGVAAQQQLLFQQTTLDDDTRTLASYGIGDGATLQLLLLKARDLSEGFHLQCGRPGLDLLETSSRVCGESIAALMAWSLPPSSKLCATPTPLLSSLLLHTRRLVSEVHSFVREKTLHGHSSRGRVWIDEAALREQCQRADEAARIQIDDEEDENRINAGGFASASASSPTLKRSASSLLLDNDDDGNDNGQMGRVIPLVRAPVVDLTGGDSALQHDDDEIQLINSPVQARPRVSKKQSTAPNLPSVAATTSVDEVASDSASRRRKLSPSPSSSSSFSSRDTPPPLERVAHMPA